jgi:hypothetical protein
MFNCPIACLDTQTTSRTQCDSTLTSSSAKTKPSYLQRAPSHTGSAWTILLLVASVSLIISETRRWYGGDVSHSFTVEKSVSHQLQINLDVIVAMRCDDLHVNVQDASGDRILAGDKLNRDPTSWEQWAKATEHKLADKTDDAAFGLGDDEDVHDYLGAARKGRRKFPKTPRIKGLENACRIYGSMEGNKVQGDFHITARGHGYFEFGMHLDHQRMLKPILRCDQLLTSNSIQLLPYNQRTVLRPSLPPLNKSPLQNPC